MPRIWGRNEPPLWWEFRKFQAMDNDPAIASEVEKLNALSDDWRKTWMRARRGARKAVLVVLVVAFFLMGLTPAGFVWREALVRAGEGVFTGVAVGLLIVLGRRWTRDRNAEFDRIGEERAQIFKELEARASRTSPIRTS